MIKYLKDNRGLTLIEILVSLAILGIIAVPISSFFVNTIRINKNSEDKMIANQLAQKYMEQVKFEEATTTSDDELIGTEGEFKIYKTVSKDLEEGKSYSINKGNQLNSSMNYHIKLEVDTDEYNNTKDKVVFKESNIGDITEGNIDNNYTARIRIEKISSGEIKIYFNDNPNYRYVNNIDLSEDINHNDPINIEISSKGKKNINIEVDSIEDTKTNIYIVKSKKSENEIDIKTMRGRIYSYENIYDNSVEKSENSWVYKIIVTVKKKEEELVKLIGLKKID